MFNTPSFWYQEKSFLSILLTPLSWLYQVGHIILQFLPKDTYEANIPVICVGNAIAGGGGKTPMVIALVKLLKEQEAYKNPYIITRGYGRKTNEPLLVDPGIHSAEYAGDEPLLLVQHAPTIVCSDRGRAAALAEKKGADIILMDDGLLNRSLYKDLSFLVVDRKIDFGNNKTLPAGPLRESLPRILSRVDAVITIGRPFDAADHPVFESQLIADQKPSSDKKYIAFAGIAIPDKFKNTLLDLGYVLKGWFPFPDHHPYSKSDIQKLTQTDGHLITTEKDYVRLPSKFKNQIETLPVHIQIIDPNRLIEFIKNRLKP